MERLIYTLSCPVTGEVHYIGKSTQGMRRPMQHLTDSHSQKIREWVDDLKQLNHRPVIKVIYEVKDNEDIDYIEKMTILQHIKDGCVLLNESLTHPVSINPSLEERLSYDPHNEYKHIGKFVADRRKAAGLTQVDFAYKMGVSLRFLRKLEQGYSNIMINKVLYVLKAFGCTLSVKKIK